MAKRHTSDGRPARQAGPPSTPPAGPAGTAPAPSGSSATRPAREAPDTVALLVAGAVLAAIAVAAWLALFKPR
jgi:hypothetical protein